jgi:hypothetical protein
MTDGAALTGKDGKRVVGPPGKTLLINHFGKGPWQMSLVSAMQAATSKSLTGDGICLNS